MAAEFTELGEYHLNDEEKGLIQKLLFSIENEKHPICTESAYDLSEFFGWKDAKNRAIKKYLVEIDGPKRLLEKFKTATEPGLRLALGSCGWRFCELHEHTMAMFEVGAVPAALELFKSEDEDFWRKGLGWLCCFLEYDSLLDHIAAEGVIEVLVDRILANKPSETSFLLGAAAQMCAVNENCRTGLLRVVPHVVQYLLDEGTWLFGEDRGHLILEANHMGTLLALMVLDDRIWTVATKEEVATALDNHVSKYSATLINSLEIAYGYLWTSLSQWILLLESNNVLLQRAGAFAMAHLAIQAVNRESIIKQGVFGRLQMLLHSPDPIVVQWSKFALDLFRRENLKPATLQTQAYWQLIKTNGDKKTRELMNAKNIGLHNIK